MDNTDDIYDALYKALDTLEELDPNDSDEPWVQVLEKALNRAVRARLGQLQPAQDWPAEPHVYGAGPGL
jgi:hypothetical protein